MDFDRKNAPQIRRATSADAAALTALGRRTFSDTFASSNTSEDMAMYLDQAYTEPAQRREIEDAKIITLVADDEGTLVGFAQLQPGHRSACIDDPGEVVEIYRFYVDRPYHGRGVARAMMDEVERIATARNTSTLWLAVWEHNPRAIAFYTKCGFRDAGSQPFLLGTDLQTDRVMMRRLR